MTGIWVIIILSLLFSAFFSGMEIAFVSSSRLQQELDLKKKLLPAKILSDFYNQPSRFIGALLLGDNIALVVYGIAMALVLEPVIVQQLQHFSPAFRSEFMVLVIQTIVSTLLILVVAEFTPKVLFRINPNAILHAFAIPIWIFYYLFYPFIILYIGISEWLLRVFAGLDVSKNPYVFSAIDLDEYVQELHQDEEVEAEYNQEIQMIQNAIEFKNVKLRDCMVPRMEMVVLAIDEPVETLRKLFTRTGHSKIMIYGDNIDNILGYVHAYDLFTRPEKIENVLRKAAIFPETMAAKDVLNYFIQNHKSVAIVVDEFGGTSGMVTMEDIIEEIFGEIEDEYDKEQIVEKQLSENEYIFSARIEVDTLNEKYKLDIPVSEEYETLAGFILHHYESIPKKNEIIQIPHFEIQVIKASGNRLEEVKITKLTHQES